MAVIKICDSALVDGDDGASLFDDNNENNNYFENQNSLGNDLSVRIIKPLNTLFYFSFTSRDNIHSICYRIL